MHWRTISQGKLQPRYAPQQANNYTKPLPWPSRYLLIQGQMWHLQRNSISITVRVACDSLRTYLASYGGFGIGNAGNGLTVKSVSYVILVPRPRSIKTWIRYTTSPTECLKLGRRPSGSTIYHTHTMVNHRDTTNQPDTICTCICVHVVYLKWNRIRPSS
jgi:hypothetical protein